MRVRRVYPTVEVCELWARERLDEATNSHGNVYFVGDTIYSYGKHFPMAHHVKRGNLHVVLLNCRSYSSTTHRHQSHVRRALQNWLSYFEVPYIFPEFPLEGGWTPDMQKPLGHAPNLEWFRRQIVYAEERVLVARHRKTDALETLDAHIVTAQRYAHFFDLDEQFAASIDLYEQRELADVWDERRTALQARNRVLVAQRREARRQQWQQQQQEWVERNQYRRESEVNLNVRP